MCPALLAVLPGDERNVLNDFIMQLAIHFPSRVAGEALESGRCAYCTATRYEMLLLRIYRAESSSRSVETRFSNQRFLFRCRPQVDFHSLFAFSNIVSLEPNGTDFSC